jgi:hypothetical protein
MFGKGYQKGRESSFRMPYPWTDADLVGCLQATFAASQHRSEEEREQRLYYSVGLLLGEVSGRVLARQPYEDEMRDLQEQLQRSPRPQTPVEISHPMFRKGYQEGRERFFQERYVLTDQVLLDCLESFFEPSEHPHETAEERAQRLHDKIGQLVGEICGWVLAREGHEEQTQNVQEALLAKVAQKYEETGKALMKTIRQFWVVHDQLTYTLDAELFEEVIKCCPQKRT